MYKTQTITKWLLDILFPQKDEEKAVINLTCETFLEKATKSCDANLPAHTYAPFSYKDKLVKTAIGILKYRADAKVGKILAECLYKETLPFISDLSLFDGIEKFLVLPVPLSKKKEKTRGFNQSRIITDYFIKQNEELFFTQKNIFKREDRPPQTKLKRKERLENLKNAFEIKDREKIKDKDILLIDDVSTTGSTFSEMRRILLTEGARSVNCIAIAH